MLLSTAILNLMIKGQLVDNSTPKNLLNCVLYEWALPNVEDLGFKLSLREQIADVKQRKNNHRITKTSWFQGSYKIYRHTNKNGLLYLRRSYNDRML